MGFWPEWQASPWFRWSHWPSPVPYQDIPMYSNTPSPTRYYEDIQTLDPKEPDLVVHQSPDRSPTFVKDVLSEEEELVEIQESDPHFECLTSPDDSAGVTLASSHSDHVVIFYKLVGRITRTLEIPLISTKEYSHSVLIVYEQLLDKELHFLY
ncbi:unnamed protein product [Caretta caretta]